MLFKVYYIVGLLVLNENHILYGPLFEWFLWGIEFRCVAVMLLFYFLATLGTCAVQGCIKSWALSVLVQVFV